MPCDDTGDDCMESPLCDNCKAVLSLYPRAKLVQPFYSITPESFVLQAANGCHLCLLFLSRNETWPEGKLHYQKYTRGHACVRHLYLGGKPLTLSLLPPNLAGLSMQSQLRNDISTIKEGSSSSYVLPEPSTIVRRYQLSTSTLAQIESWMTECQTHQDCQRTSATQQFLPSRLIHIRDYGPKVPQLRLVHRHSLFQDVSYATLSHCWGPKPHHLRLLQSNISAFEDSISFSNLPATFRDAIIVCQQLNISYLWIDSLCIIQDSPADKDWQHEASEMGLIYASAICNLCATSAHDSSGGLFTTPSHTNSDTNSYQSAFSKKRVLLKLGNGEEGQHTYLAVSPLLWPRGVEDSPLLSRAWVVQERYLSRCNIHFSFEQVFWECSTMSACEETTTFLLSDVYPAATRKKDFALLRQQDITEGGGGKDIHLDEFLLLWYGVVQDYSARALTRETDRLVALSGVAAAFQERWPAVDDAEEDMSVKAINTRKREYIAGLWSYNIIPQLLWYRVSPGPRPTSYIAPSWSWAAVNDRIRGSMEDEIASAGGTKSLQTFMSTASVISWDVRRLNEAQLLGQLTAGTIILAGRLALATVVATSKDAIGEHLHFEGLLDSFLFSGGEKSTLKKDFTDGSDEGLRKGSVVYCVPLRAKTLFVPTSHYPHGIWTLEGLLLFSAHSTKEATLDEDQKPMLPTMYRRVGTWKLKGADHIRGFIAAMEHCDEKYRHLLTETCDAIEAFGTGNKAFQINIV